MYYDFTIPVPDVQGKIIISKRTGGYYVLYQYGQEYKPDKQFAIPKRTVIGKRDDINPSLMYPNDKFQQFFPNVILPEHLPEAYRSCALRIGAYVIIKHVFDEYRLPTMLHHWFKENTGLLQDLVCYLIIEEDNAGQYYPDFAFNHPLFSERMRVYSDSKVCRFLRSVTKDQIYGFQDDWNRKRDHKQRIYISYDSTNKNCEAGDIDIVEYGKAKDDKGLPIFNIAVAYDKTNRIPLFYEEYPGSITDVSQFTYMVNKVEEYGYKNVGSILDRGYFSKENINYIEDNGYAFILMVKGCKKLVSALVDEYHGSFETDRDCAIRTYRVYGKTVTARLYEDDTKDRYFHIYFNASRQAAEREKLEQSIDKMKLFLDKHKGEDLSLSSTYEDYFILRRDKDRRIISYDERKDTIQHLLDLCGYFCIITSEPMTAAEALIHYKGRDISEKLFSADKSFIDSKSMRVQTAAALSAKIFIEFIALIVRNRIYNLLKETMLRLETRPNYMTVPAAIRELEKIEMVRRNEGVYKLDHAVSKRQKIILSSFGMDENSISLAALEISNYLANNQLPPGDSNDQNGEEVDDDGTYEIDYLD